MPYPIQNTADVRRIVDALRFWLAAYESNPIGRVSIANGFDRFRRAFGEPGNAPEGVSLNSLGLPEGNGLTALIRSSSGITVRSQDVLSAILKLNANAGNCIFISDDRPNADPVREADRKLREPEGDFSVISEFRTALRIAIELLEEKKTVPAGNIGKGGAVPIVNNKPKLANLYELIIAEWDSNRDTGKTIAALSAKKDVAVLAKELGKTIDGILIKAAKSHRDRTRNK